MILYFINTLLALLLAKAFYDSKNGLLREILILLFISFAYYQFVNFVILCTGLTHGTPISYYSKLPFTISMCCLIFYIYKIKIINYYKKCLNFLIQLRKKMQK